MRCAKEKLHWESQTGKKDYSGQWNEGQDNLIPLEQKEGELETWGKLLEKY